MHLIVITENAYKAVGTNMIRTILMALSVVFLAACEPLPGEEGGRPGDGTVVVRLNKIGAEKIMYRHLDAVNAIRVSRGQTPVVMSPELNIAASRHAADMAKQNRPWHFGSDGSSPFDRVAAAGFTGPFLGENISETFEDDFNTLNVWMSDPLSEAVVLSAGADAMGLGWVQESNGKIWWVQLFGKRSLQF